MTSKSHLHNYMPPDLSSLAARHEGRFGRTLGYSDIGYSDIRFVILHFLVPVRHEVFLHVANPRKWASTFRTNVWLVADPAEWLSGKFGRHVCVSMDEAVLLKVTVASELPVALQTGVDFFQAASIHLYDIQALLSTPSVHLHVFLHVLHPRVLSAAVRAHVESLGVARVPFQTVRRVRLHVLPEAQHPLRREGAHGAREPVLVGVADQM